jgi:hypothetical protein
MRGASCIVLAKHFSLLIPNINWLQNTLPFLRMANAKKRERTFFCCFPLLNRFVVTNRCNPDINAGSVLKRSLGPSTRGASSNLQFGWGLCYIGATITYLKAFENMVRRRLFVPRREEQGTGEIEVMTSCISCTLDQMCWARYVARSM